MKPYQKEHLQALAKLVEDKLTEVTQTPTLPEEVRTTTAQLAELAKEVKEELGKS